MIIAAYAGTGKTYLSQVYPQAFTDFVCMPYKYMLNEYIQYDESHKADVKNIINEEWPYNYVDAIKQEFQNNTALLIPSDIYVLALLQKEKMPYMLCYPQRDARELYRHRFIERGNTENFIRIFIGNWDFFMDHFEQDSYGKHIVLQPHEYLSDIFDSKVKPMTNNPPG